jgi:DNA repair protein RecN (Recombination protein N)
MLRHLRLKNIAVVEEVSLDFEDGFTVFTGETGAGKSILVESLSLLAGGRASEELVRTGAEEALVEAVFEAGGRGSLRTLLEERGFEADDTLVLTRRIARGGGNRVFVNRAPARVQDLAALGAHLLGIHGQSEQAFLREPAFHREALDAFAGHMELLAEGAPLYARLSSLEERLKNLHADASEKARRAEMLRFQVEDIERHGFRRGEDERLRAEEKILAQAQRFGEWTASALSSLEGEGGACESLLAARKAVERLAEMDPAFRESAELLSEASVRAEECASALASRAGAVDMRPERLAEVQARLYALDRLCRKYGPALDAVLDAGESARAELAEMEGGGESAEKIEGMLRDAAEGYAEWHARLAASRERAARRMKQALEREFSELALEKARFDARFAVLPRAGSPLMLEGRPAEYGVHGAQSVEFFFSANPGEDMKPLSKTASGGELARVMLALKTLTLPSDAPRALVFDEVDAGVSGRVAEAVGARLRALAGLHQVLCVTHLPQVAAQGRRHFRVEKAAAKGRTRVAVKALSGKERTEEIARLLAGREVTDSARRHADEMLRAAGN